jgi:hypothetical protein
MRGNNETRCGKRSGKWQCKRNARYPYTYCDDCRTISAESKHRKRAREGRCKWCYRPVRGRAFCYTCTAKKRESDFPHLQHDTREHARMLRARHHKYSRCAASGISLLTLEKMGDMLSVDRINPRKGYVRGNMQLLSKVLNSTKGSLDKVPRAAIRKLRRRLVRFANDRLTAKFV